MNINDEMDAFKALGITSWSQINPSSFVQLKTVFRGMDKELAMKILPQLAEMIPAKGIDVLKEIVNSGNLDQERFYAYQEKSLQALSDSMPLAESAEERAQIREEMRLHRQEIFEKDTENKQHQKDLTTIVVSVICASITAALISAAVVHTQKA